LALALILTSLRASAQATGAPPVNEPAFPTPDKICATLTAQLPIANGEPGSETAFDTSRIQSALSACPTGQAVELTRAGSNAAFLIQPITIPAGVTLLVDGGVTVFASRNPVDYQASGAVETCGTVGLAGNGCKNLITVNANTAVMGYGVIDGRGGDQLLDGSGHSWWDLAALANDGTHDQNNFVLLKSNSTANNVTLYKITLRNSAMFHVVWKGFGFTAWGVKIATPFTARNSDGIDPGGTNITIANSYISDGDDNVAISASSPAANITVSNLHAYSGHGISVGSFTQGGLSNMLVDHVYLAGTVGDGSANALRIKSAADRGGLVNNVTWQNLCAKDVAHAVVIDPFYNSSSGTQIPQYTNILLRNAHFLNEGRVEIEGHDATHLTSLTLDNVVFENLGIADLTPVPQYASITLGPGAVYPSLLQALTGTGVTVTGSAPATNTTAFPCAITDFPQAMGELYLSTPSATNLKTLSLQGPASFTLEATVQPTMSQVSYTLPDGSRSWTGVPALTQPVNFLENGNVVGSGTLVFNGTLATATLNNVAGGTHTYVAQYPGDANYPAYTFGSVTVTVTAPASIPSTTQLSAPASGTVGDALSLTATVSGSGAVPTGSVQFSSDGASLGSAPLVNGSATLAISALHGVTAGTHSLTAAYAGDAVYSPSTSAASSLSVGKGQTSVALTLPASAAVGLPLTLQATVTCAGGVPDGSVTFMNGAATVGTVPLVSGSATLKVTPGAIGPLPLSANYSGSTSFVASSAAQTLSVVPPFTIDATPTAVSLPAQVSVSLAPQGGFSGSVDLTCATSSPTVGCSLSQSSVALGAPATVSVNLSGATAQALGFTPLLPAGLFFLGRSRRKRRRSPWLFLFAFLAVACGGGSTATSKTQVVTVTARSGTNSASVQIQVTAP
jgi:hypothetical protein